MSLKLPDKEEPNLSRSYTDEQVMTAVRREDPYDQLVLKWFFLNVREYTLGYWKKKYSRLQQEEWEVIFANTNLKFITRIRNGLVLRPGTRLKTYYTSVVGYAILDFLESKKEKRHIPIAGQDLRASVPATDRLEKAQLAELIREELERITANAEQVKVMLLHAKGYSYKEILERTDYKSEGACRNAFLKGKKKIVEYILAHPEDGRRLKAMILGG
jgi:hypothetical protein